MKKELFGSIAKAILSITTAVLFIIVIAQFMLYDKQPENFVCLLIITGLIQIYSNKD